MKKNLIIIFGVILFIGLGFALINEIVLSYTKITINNKLPVAATIYPSIPGEEGSVEFNKEDRLMTTPASSKNTIKLKKNRTYVAVLDKPKDYQTKMTSFNTIDSNKVVVINSDFSREKLDSLIFDEKDSLTAAINGQLKNWMSSYSLTTIKLYGQGDWAGAVFTPKDPIKYDSLRSILHKEGSNWTMLINPPRILLTKPGYPKIPSQYINDIDNFSN